MLKGLKRTRTNSQIVKRQRWYHILEHQKGKSYPFGFNTKPYFLKDKRNNENDDICSK